MVATEEISTTGDPAAISLSADRDAISADRLDVSHVTVKILDAQGRFVPVADNEFPSRFRGKVRLSAWTAETR